MKKMFRSWFCLMIFSLSLYASEVSGKNSEDAGKALLNILNSCSEQQNRNIGLLKDQIFSLDSLSRMDDEEKDIAAFNDIYLIKAILQYRNNQSYKLVDRVELKSDNIKNIEDWTSAQYVAVLTAKVKSAFKNVLDADFGNRMQYIPYFMDMQQTTDVREVLMNEVIELSSRVNSNYNIRPVVMDINMLRTSKLTSSLYAEMLKYYKRRGTKKQLIQTELKLLSLERISEDLVYSRYMEIYDQAKDSDLEVMVLNDAMRYVSIHPNNNSNYASALQLFNKSVEAVKKWPKSDYSCQLRNQIRDFSTPEVRVKVSSVYSSDKASTLTADIFQVKSLSLKIFDGDKVSYEKSYEYDSLPSYEWKKASLDIPALSYGKYTMQIDFKAYGNALGENVVDTKTKKIDFVISDLADIVSVYNSVATLWVGDNMIGRSKPGVEVKLYQMQKQNGKALVGTYTSDQNGMVKFTSLEKGKSYVYQVSYGNDKYKQEDNFWYNPTVTQVKPTSSVDIYVDRAVFMPGEAVKFGLIYSLKSQTDSKLLKGKEIRVSLKDVNGKVVSTLNLTTDQWGFASGEFKLPQEMLNGLCSIYSDMGSAYFEVADYVAPKMEIQLDKQFKNNELIVDGKLNSFSGNSVSGLTVVYYIDRLFNRWTMQNDNEQSRILLDKTTTGKDGNFAIVLSRKQLAEMNKASYKLTCEVTTKQGERVTQSSFLLSENNITLSVDLLNQYQANTDGTLISVLPVDGAFEIKVTATDMPGNSLSLPLNLELISQQDTSQVFQLGEYTTSKALRVDMPYNLNINSRVYKLRATVKNENGVKFENAKTVAFYNKGLNNLPYDSPIVFFQNSSKIEEAEEAWVYFGSNIEDAELRLNIYAQNSIVEQRVFNTKAAEMHQLNLSSLLGKYQHIVVNATLANDLKVWDKVAQFNVEKKAQKLDVREIDFNKEVEPGVPVKWKFQVVNASGEGVQSHVTVSMFDKALDQLRNNYWAYQGYIWAYYRSVSNYYDKNSTLPYLFSKSAKMETCKPTPRAILKSFCFDNYMFATRRYNGMPPIQVLSSTVSEKTESSTAGAADKNTTSESENIDIRENLTHGGIFFPEIITDENGYFTIDLTTPYLLTIWNLQMIAYDKQCYSVTANFETRTRKDLMIDASLPSFVRHNDKLDINVEVNSSLDKMPAGLTTLKIYDGLTDKLLSTKKVNINIGQRGSIIVPMKINIPEDVSSIDVELIAQCGSYSDAVRYVLPVLSTRRLVTRTKTFNLKSGDVTNDVVFESFIEEVNRPTLDNYSYTLQYNNSPVYTLFDIIPYVDNKQMNSAADASASLFFNSILNHIKNTKAYEGLFDYYSEVETTSDLTKNEEVKSILLDNTPWVMDAISESGKRTRIAGLVKADTVKKEMTEALNKLYELQNIDGGFKWNSYINSSQFTLTNAILLNLGRLTEMGAIDKDEQTSMMIYDAMRYTDSVMVARKINIDSNVALEWMYMRSFYMDIPFGDALKVSKEIVNACRKRSFGPMELNALALSSILCRKFGFVMEADKLNEELIKRATKTQNMGIYWANNTPQMGNIIQTHTNIMKALSLGNISKDDIDLLKLWLLNQKRRQMWDGIPNSIDAVYALFNNDESLINKPVKAKIAIGPYLLSSTNSDYFVDTTFYYSDVKRSLGTLKITKESSEPAYGSIYWQYYDDIDQIQTQDNGLSIDKTIFKKVETATGTEYQSLDSAKLKLGDKVLIQLEVRSDDNYDYVIITDERAACLQPVSQLASYDYADGLSFYEDSKIVSTTFFIESMPKGRYSITYECVVNAQGQFNSGVSTIESYYSPGFRGNSYSQKLYIAKE